MKVHGDSLLREKWKQPTLFHFSEKEGKKNQFDQNKENHLIKW